MNIMQSIKKAGEKVISTAKKPILVAGTVLALSGSLQSCDNLSPEGQYSWTEEDKIALIKTKNKFDSSFQRIMTLPWNDYSKGIAIQWEKNELTNETFTITKDPNSLAGVFISENLNGQKTVTYYVVCGRVEKLLYPNGHEQILWNAKEAQKIYGHLNRAIHSTLDSTDASH